MAKQVVIQRVERGPGGDNDVTFIFWIAIAAGREIPVLNGASGWAGASVAENAAIAAGSVIEETYSIQYPLSMTKSQVEAALVAQYNARQAVVSAKPNPNQFFGTFFDSVTGWSA